MSEMAIFRQPSQGNDAGCILIAGSSISCLVLRLLGAHSVAKVQQVAIVGVVLAALSFCGVWFVQKYFGIEAHGLAMRLWPPATADQVAQRQLHSAASWFSLDCGHVRHGENSTDAIACTQDALRTGRRFYVAFDWVENDSKGTTGLVANSKGLYEVDTLEFRYESIGGPTVDVSGNIADCQKFPIHTISHRGDRVLTCLLTDEEGPGGPIL